MHPLVYLNEKLKKLYRELGEDRIHLTMEIRKCSWILLNVEDVKSGDTKKDPAVKEYHCRSWWSHSDHRHVRWNVYLEWEAKYLKWQMKTWNISLPEMKLPWNDCVGKLWSVSRFCVLNKDPSNREMEIWHWNYPPRQGPGRRVPDQLDGLGCGLLSEAGMILGRAAPFKQGRSWKGTMSWQQPLLPGAGKGGRLLRKRHLRLVPYNPKQHKMWGEINIPSLINSHLYDTMFSFTFLDAHVLNICLFANSL